MKKSFFNNIGIVFIFIFLPGCVAIADIFKAGLWSGIIIVMLIIIFILFLTGRSKKA